MKNFTFIILFIILLFYSCTERKNSLHPPTGLICNLLRYPGKAAITDPNPEFGWIFPIAGVKQSACRILVATSNSLLSEGKADSWDSKKIITGESTNLKYTGKKLSPNTSYWWKVKVWDQNKNESDYSTPQKFYTSNFTRSDEKWPGESKFIQLPDSSWVSENRQTSTFHSLKPAEFIHNKKNNWFADFGKAAFGTLELKINSESDNDTLNVYLGERKNKNYTVNKNPGKSNIGFLNLDLSLIKGTHNYFCVIPPHHSNAPQAQKLPPFYPEVTPFRYVEINGNDNEIKIIEVKQRALFYPFNDDASYFESSDTNLNKVWNLCKYTLKATPFLGIYADGNRERMPYEADSYIQQLGNYCVDREFSIARYTLDFLLYHASWPTEWNMITVLMAWQDYMNTGNAKFLKDNYDLLKNKTLIALENEDGLISTTTGKVTPEFLKSIHFNGNSIQDIVDWPPGTPKGKIHESYAGPTPEGERDGYVFTDINTVVNSYHYYTLTLMAHIAGVLNNGDKSFFISRATKVKNSILANLFDKRRGIFVDGIGTDHSSLHSNMFPLVFGLVPPQNLNTVISFIENKGMACSVYGAQFLLEGLFNAGEANYAISLMTSDSKRSWLNMIKVGSTMTTEAWDEYYKPNLTWNHAWGTAPANIIPRKLMGIEPISAGFKKFRIVPQPGDIERISLKIPTIKGTIKCDLLNHTNNWLLTITVPGNCEAELFIPARFTKIYKNSKLYSPDKKESFANDLKNVVNLKSGTYVIAAE